MSMQDLRNQRANLWEQMKECRDEAAEKGWSGELEAKYDRLEGDLDKLGNQIEREERHEKLSAKLESVDRSNVVPPSDELDDREEDQAFAKAFNSFLVNGIHDMDPEDRKIMQSQFKADSSIKNAAGVATGAAGGYTVPLEFRDKIVETMKWYGPMLQEAEIFETDSGVNIPWATNDDTGNVGSLLSENTQVTEQDLTFGTASLDAFMYTSKLVRVSFQLLQDRPDVDTYVARKLGERIGRILNQHFTTGTGTAQPDGIVTSSTVGVTGTGSFATTGGIAYDNLVDLVESIDPAYGNAADGTGQAPGLKFMGHQSVRKQIRKLKDSQNRPLWEPSLQAGQPDTLLGYGFRINNDMATLAQSSKSLIFGDFRTAYVIRLVKELQMLRLAERYADFLQVGFLGFKRCDGTLQDANAVRVFQTTATA